MNRKNLLLVIFFSFVLCVFFQAHTAEALSVTYDYGASAKASLDDDGTLTITGEDSIYAAGNIANAIGEENVPKVKKLVISGNITRTYSYNFAAMHNLTEIVVGDSVVYMAENTFENCISLKKIVLGAKIEAFHVTGTVQKVLQEVQVSPDNPYLTVVDGVLFSKDMKELVYYPASLEANSYSIPDTVETIGSYAIRYVSNLRFIEIPDSVTKISSHAFEYSTGIEELVIPESVDTLEYGSFMFAGVKSIIYNGTANPPDRCFDSCNRMTSLKITSNQVTEIGDCAACDCSSLEDVYLSESVKVIGVRTFENCHMLKYINVPGNIEKIGASAFYRCGVLKDFAFPRSIIYMGSSAFEGTQVASRPWWLTVLGDGSYSASISINYTGTVDYDGAFELLNEINEERKNNGCLELKLDASLNAGAVARAEDLPVMFSTSRLDMTDGLEVSDKAEKQMIIFGTSYENAVNYMKRNYRSELESSKYVSCGIACFYQEYSKYYSVLLSSKDAVNEADQTGKQYVRVYRNCEFNVINKENFTVPGELSIEVGSSKQVVTGIREYDAYNWYEYFANRILKLNPDSFKYDTSDHMIASVDENGMITGHSAGECTLFIYSKETKQWKQQYKVMVTGEGNDGYVDDADVSEDSQEKNDGEMSGEAGGEEFYYSSMTDYYVTGTYLYEEAFEHLRMLNELREQEGVAPLVMDKKLMETAMTRSVECLMMYEHLRPNGENLRDLCSYADSENITWNGRTRSPRVALSDLYNDIPHRENMLSASWKSVGIGVFVQDGNVFYVQDFSTDEAHEEALQTESVQVSLKLPCMTRYVGRNRLLYSPIGMMKIGDTKSIRIEMYNLIDDDIFGTPMGIVPDNKTFEFVNKTPDLIDVDENGVITAKAVGSWQVVAKLPSNSKIQIICIGGITEYGSGYDLLLSQEEYDADMNRFMETTDEEKPDDSDDDNDEPSDEPSAEPPKPGEADDEELSVESPKPGEIDDVKPSAEPSKEGEANDVKPSAEPPKQGNDGDIVGGGNNIEDDNGNNGDNIDDGNNQEDDTDDDYSYYVPYKVKKVKLKNKKKRKIVVSWRKLTYAEGYQIQYAKNKKFTKGKKKRFVKGTKCTIKKLSKNKTYYVRVRAYSYDSDGDIVYGKWSAVVRKKVKK